MNIKLHKLLLITSVCCESHIVRYNINVRCKIKINDSHIICHIETLESHVLFSCICKRKNNFRNWKINLVRYVRFKEKAKNSKKGMEGKSIQQK
jgi:hypothetical protein